MGSFPFMIKACGDDISVFLFTEEGVEVFCTDFPLIFRVGASLKVRLGLFVQQFESNERNVSPWPRLTNSSPLSEWCQETSLSKNVKAWILRANHHEPPRHQPSDDFAHLCTLGRSIIEGDAKWDGDLRFTGEFRYTKGYWEWTEDVLSRCGDRLRHLKIYDAVYASLFTYDHNSDIVKAFCEAWCPLTNTLHTSAGEMSISLWDLHELVGLPMTGCLYDEVVPSALELTGVDEKRERFIPRS
ncbi:hypothetical protein Sango_1719900, partial [Sesamum angolense]